MAISSNQIQYPVLYRQFPRKEHILTNNCSQRYMCDLKLKNRYTLKCINSTDLLSDTLFLLRHNLY